MVNFIASDERDVQQIREWTSADPWHKDQKNPEWWLSGNGFLSFCAKDEIGPIYYARIDNEDGWFRINCQFAPRATVSRERVVEAIDTFFLTMSPHFASTPGAKGMRFYSESPHLIKFLEARGFKASEKDDFVREF